MLWTLFYFGLARFLKRFSRVVQLHSVVHCFTAVFLSTWAFHILSDGDAFGLDMYHTILGMRNESHKDMLKQVAYHTAGYFIADTIDILLDDEDKKRKQYILHHVAALAGLCTIFYDSYMSLYGVWLLECGGVVHHIKYASQVLQWPNPWSTLAEVLYHSVYVSSRLLLIINTTKGFYYLNESLTKEVDVICFVVVYILVIQNTIWWYKNARSLIDGEGDGRSRSRSGSRTLSGTKEI